MRCMGGHCTRDAAHGPGAVDPRLPRLYLTLGRPGGGTGRHTVLRGQRRKASRFESGPGHSSQPARSQSLDSPTLSGALVPAQYPTTPLPGTPMRCSITLAVMVAAWAPVLRAQGKFPPDSFTNL